MHRGSSDGMLKPDAEAEKVRRRKERKRAKQIRTALAAGDMKSVVRLHLEGRSQPAPAQSDECPDCLALKRRTA